MIIRNKKCTIGLINLLNREKFTIKTKNSSANSPENSYSYSRIGPSQRSEEVKVENSNLFILSASEWGAVSATTKTKIFRYRLHG